MTAIEVGVVQDEVVVDAALLVVVVDFAVVVVELPEPAGMVLC